MDIALTSLLEECLGVTKVYVLIISNYFKLLCDFVDSEVSGARPSYLVLGTVLATYITLLALRHMLSFFAALRSTNYYQIIKSLPVVRGIVQRKLASIRSDTKKELVQIYGGEEYITKLPTKSTSPEVLLKRIKHYQLFDTSVWQQGRISGAVYTNNNSRYNELLLSVYASNMWSNPLHADVFASIRKMEAEIVRMVASMYKGQPDETIGSVTSGGTESIVMACKAYRDYGIKVTGIRGQPEIIAPVTAHAAFEKAANFLGCKIIHIPVNKRTMKVNLKKMRQSISANTCMLVGSAPQFPHGIIDPIKDIAALGLRHKVPVHVDACLGGFLIPFMSQAGYNLDEEFDFSVQGVTSISADTHKYGYSPKGTSVILYRDRKYIHHQYSIQTDWPGGIYASPTLPGSRPGALIATCWAAMMHHGLEGYVEATGRIIKTTRYIKKELSDVPGLKILGNPLVSVLAFSSDTFDIYILNQRLKDLGWNLNALQFPSSFHLCVTLMHTSGNVATSFVNNVKEIIAKLGEEPKSKPSGSAAIYGMAQTIPDRSIVAELCTSYLDGCLGY